MLLSCFLLSFVNFKGKVLHGSANQKLGRPSSFFEPARKTNLVENVVTLLPVKIRLIPLSGFREEVSKIENVPSGIQCEKSRKRYGMFGLNGFINWSISKSPKGGRNQVSGRDRNTPVWLNVNSLVYTKTGSVLFFHERDVEMYKVYKCWQNYVREGHKKQVQCSLLCIVLHKKKLKVHLYINKASATHTLQRLNNQHS